MSKVLQLYEDRSWGLVYSRYKHEKKVKSYLDGHNIPCYLPVLKKVKSKYRTNYEPMFYGYLFAAWNCNEKDTIRRFESVVNVTHFKQKEDTNILQQMKLLLKIEELSENYDIDLSLANENDKTVSISLDEVTKFIKSKKRKINSLALNLISGNFKLSVNSF